MTLWLTPDDRRTEVIMRSVQRQPSTARALFQVVRFDEALSAMLGVNT
jgi:hypothetical protein